MIDYAVQWLKRARAAGLVIPATYIAFDLETTGLKIEKVFITQTGHLSTINGVPGEAVSTLLGWPNCNGIDQIDLRTQLVEVEQDYARRGETYRFNYELLRNGGAEPLRVIELYHDTFSKHQSGGGYFAAHNGASFDTQVWQMHFRKYLDSDFHFNLDRLFDTGLIQKSINLSYRRHTKGRTEWFPQPGETMAWYYYRTYNEFGHGFKWNLRATVEMYGLDKKYNLDLNEAHNADFDCIMTHLLVEKFRELADS